jgi:hypothetical protein
MQANEPRHFGKDQTKVAQEPQPQCQPSQKAMTDKRVRRENNKADKLASASKPTVHA